MKTKHAMVAILLIVFAVIALVHPQLVSAQEPEQNLNSSQDSQEANTTSIGRTLRDWAGGIQASVTVVAILVGGYLAWRNLRIFRAREPHVTISHDISHRPISAQYIHIAVTATLRNSSRVNVAFRDGSFILQQVAPSSDTEIEDLYAEVFAEEGQTYLQWRTLEDVRRAWGEDELVVEPGESQTDTYEFVVTRHIKSVAITTYFYNSRVLREIPDNTEPQPTPRRRQRLLRRREVRGPLGWGRTTIHDIILGQEHLSAEADEGNGTDASEEKNNHNP